jgi:hypothetical protein
VEEEASVVVAAEEREQPQRGNGVGFACAREEEEEGTGARQHGQRGGDGAGTMEQRRAEEAPGRDRTEELQVQHGGAHALAHDVRAAGVIRLSALIDLYIHPLKGIFYSHHKIYSFSASIHPLYHPLSTVGSTCHFI